MNRINRKTLDQLAKLAQNADEIHDEIAAMIDRFSDDLQAVIERFNEPREEAAQIMADLAGDAESYYDEKSERWQEGERGSAYAEWRDMLNEISGQLEEAAELPDIAPPDRPEWIDRLADPDFEEPAQ